MHKFELVYRFAVLYVMIVLGIPKANDVRMEKVHNCLLSRYL